MTRVSNYDRVNDRCHLQFHDNVHLDISFNVFNQLHNVLVLTPAKNVHFTCQGLAISLRGDLFVDNLRRGQLGFQSQLLLP